MAKNNNQPASGLAESDRGGSTWVKWGVFVLVIAAAATLYWQFGEALTLENLAAREAQLRALQQEYPVLVYGVAFVIYVAVTGLSLPGAAALTLVYGWYFGLLPAVVLVSFASTTGATMAFLLSRYLFRDTVQRRFGGRLVKFNEALEREGPFFLFTLRLVPAVPFFVINLVMGLTPLRTATFWWVSQVGMFPGTVVYVFAGSRVPNLQQLADKGLNSVFSPAQLTQILVAFTVLGVFPLAVRWMMKKFAPRPLDDVQETETAGEAESAGDEQRPLPGDRDR